MLNNVQTVYQMMNDRESRTLYLGGKLVELSDGFYINRNGSQYRIFYNHKKIAELDIAGGCIKKCIVFNEIVYQKLRHEAHDCGYIM